MIKHFLKKDEKEKNNLSFSEELSQILFDKGLYLISKNYRLYLKQERIYQKIKENASQKLSKKELDLFLGTLKKKTFPTHSKTIILKKKKNFISISKSIRVYIHE